MTHTGFYTGPNLVLRGFVSSFSLRWNRVGKLQTQCQQRGLPTVGYRTQIYKAFGFYACNNSHIHTLRNLVRAAKDTTGK